MDVIFLGGLYTIRMGNNDDNADAKYLSGAEADQLRTFEAAIARLAERAASGAQDADVELAVLLQGVPDSVRTEAVAQFRSLVQEIQAEKGIDAPELTPEQQRQMELFKAQERQFLAHFLTDKTLKKLREAILANPLFMSQVMNIGDELYKRGISIQLNKEQPQADQQASAQPVLVPWHMKGTGKER